MVLVDVLVATTDCFVPWDVTKANAVESTTPAEAVHLANGDRNTRVNTLDDGNVAIPTTILHHCTNGWRCADTVARCTSKASPGSSIAPLATNRPTKLKTTLVGVEGTVAPGIATTVTTTRPGVGCAGSSTVGTSTIVAVCTSCCAGCASSSTRAWRYIAWLLFCW